MKLENARVEQHRVIFAPVHDLLLSSTIALLSYKYNSPVVLQVQ